MRIGVVGYGAFGKFFTQLLLHSLPHSLEQPLIVRAVDRPSEEYTSEIQQDNNIDSSIDKSRKCEFFTYDNILGFAEGLDVVVIAVSISSLEEVLGSSCPLEVFRGKLVVDVCSVKVSVWVSQGGRCLRWILICVIMGPTSSLTLIYIIYCVLDRCMHEMWC